MQSKRRIGRWVLLGKNFFLLLGFLLALYLQSEVNVVTSLVQDYWWLKVEGNEGQVSWRNVSTNRIRDLDISNPTAVVEWLQDPEISFKDGDMFASSWFMNKEMFLESRPLDEIEYVEGACFHLLRGRKRFRQVRMALDWLDFAAEHLSLWWKIVLDADNNVPVKKLVDGGDEGRDYVYALDRVVHFLTKYRLFRTSASSLQLPHSYDRSILKPTIALISFQQYKLNEKKDAPAFNLIRDKGGHQLTVASLSATIASLIQVGMGRIVVVGYHESDEQVVREAFRLFSNSTTHTELAYARATDDMVYSKLDPINIPKASLMGLRKAMIGGDPEWTQTWLGEDDPSQWKYVYLTEPDCILNTRPSSLRSLEKALQEGLILVPHRIQPIPYHGDFPGSHNYGTFVPLNFKTPITLDALSYSLATNGGDASGDVCCDEQAGRYKPGRHPFTERCVPRNFWWRCGFWGPRHASHSNHSRLQHYDFIRLQQGTGVVILAGTEHGRRCIPEQMNTGKRHGDGRCERRMSVNHLDHPDNQWKGTVSFDDDPYGDDDEVSAEDDSYSASSRDEVEVDDDSYNSSSRDQD